MSARKTEMTEQELLSAAKQAVAFLEMLWREVSLNDFMESQREEAEVNLREAIMKFEDKPD